MAPSPIYGPRSRRSRSRSRNRYSKRIWDSSRDRTRKRQDRRPHGARLSNNYMDCKMLSFKQFVLTRVEETSPETALQDYQKYEKEYHKYNCEKFIQQHKDTGYIKEKYHPTSYLKQYDQQARRCKLNARLFREEFENTTAFNGIALVVPEEAKIKRKYKDLKTGIPLDRRGRPKPPFFLDHPASKSMVVERIPPAISKWEIQDKFQELEGYSSVLMSDPRPNEEFQRTCWVLFDSHENRDKATQVILSDPTKYSIGDFPLVVERASLPEVCRANVSPPLACATTTMEAHAALSRQLILYLDSAWSIAGGGDNGDVQMGSQWMDQIEERSIQERLDMQLTYLRRVHNLCFYSGKRCVDEMELWSLCGAGFLRPKASVSEIRLSMKDEEDQQWLAKVEQCAYELLEENQKAKCIEMSNLIELKWEAYCAEHTLKVEEERYRCDICRKLFKGPDFVVKHLRVKHEPAYDEVVDSISAQTIKENYMKDEHRQVIYPTNEEVVGGGIGGGRGRNDREIYLDGRYDIHMQPYPPPPGYPSMFTDMNGYGGMADEPPLPPPPRDWDAAHPREGITEQSTTEGRQTVFYDDI